MRKKKKSLVHIIAAILIILLLAAILSDNNRLHQTTPTPTTETLPEYKTAELHGEHKTGYTWTAKFAPYNITPEGHDWYMTIEPGTVDVDKTDEPPPLIFAYDTTGDGIIDQLGYLRVPDNHPFRKDFTEKDFQDIFTILLKSEPHKEVKKLHDPKDPNILTEEPTAEDTLPGPSWWMPTIE